MFGLNYEYSIIMLYVAEKSLDVLAFVAPQTYLKRCRTHSKSSSSKAHGE